MAWAARLIEQHFDELFYLRGEGATVQRWLSALPDDLVRSRPGCCWRRRKWRRPAAGWRRRNNCSTRPSAHPQAPPRSRSSLLPAGLAACWRTSPRGIALQRSYLAALRGERRGHGRVRIAGSGRAWRERADAEFHRPVLTWPRPSGSMAGWPRLNERSRPALPGGGRPASTPCAAWRCYHLGQVQRAQGRLDAAARTCQQALDATARPPGLRCRPQAPRMWAWARWPTSGTSSTRRSGMPARASRCAASSPTSRRWPPAWRRWRGSGRPAVIRPAPWRRSARPCRPRRARPGCSTRSRRNMPGCCWPRAT